ncbi:hypothetical protein ACWEQL_04570 [Kitasatospora sp. NPDC004240]
MSTVRTDLLALDAGTLAALANRGLVKRATKELDAGVVPELSVAPDSTLTGRFPDGTATSLPPGGSLDTGSCACGAAGVCRHRIGLVLAYQRQRNDAAATGTAPAGPAPADAAPAAPGTAPEPSAEVPARASAPAAPAPAPAPAPDWSPGALDDRALIAAVGARALATARRMAERGFTARLHRPSAVAAPSTGPAGSAEGGVPAGGTGPVGATTDDRAVRAELPTCTVRFPVPGELGYAITEAAADRRGEMVALAVLAFRAADERGLRGPYVQLDVGGPHRDGRDRRGEQELAAAVGLADELLREGVTHAGPVFTGALRRGRDGLAAAALHWPAGAMAEVVEQLDDHAARGAAYRAERLALLLGELYARDRAAGSGDTAVRGEVLGFREAGETPLRRVRLTSLGCRVRGSGERRTAEVYLAHADAGVVLTLRREWEVAQDAPTGTTGSALAGRRLLGSTLRSLAAANLVSENASRTAGRTVLIGRGRVAGTSVTPVGASWADLPEPLLVRDFAAHAARLDALPPRLIRPRVTAEAVHVVEIAGVEQVGYHPGEQRLHATVRDAAGVTATVSAAYDPVCPGALDALAGALGAGGSPGTGGADGVSHLSAVVRRSGGGLVLEPIAVLTGTGVLVPDLAPGEGTSVLAGAATPAPDPIGGALDDALAALADAAHRGLRHLDRPALTRLDDAATGLERVGLSATGALLRSFLAAHRTGGAAGSTTAWADAQIRLTVSAELHRRGGGALPS